MPFLRLTRDRRGFENTFLLHADRPGDRPRLLYWYRTAPGIMLGRSPLDEDAIRTIEENHPEIDFDWPAILALSEAMIHEEEPAPRQPRQQARKPRRGRDADRRTDEGPAQHASASTSPPPQRDGQVDELESSGATEADNDGDSGELELPPQPYHVHGLLEELVGREISTRLRARYSEIMALIHEQPLDASLRDAWARRTEPLNPELWLTPDAILAGVRNADRLFEQLRGELTG